MATVAENVIVNNKKIKNIIVITRGNVRFEHLLHQNPPLHARLLFYMCITIHYATVTTFSPLYVIILFYNTNYGSIDQFCYQG